MHDSRGVIRRLPAILAIGIVCFCIVMQMLGTPMSLWNFEYELDPVNASSLEGYSLPSGMFGLLPLGAVSSAADNFGFLHPVLREHTLLRPPNPFI